MVTDYFNSKHVALFYLKKIHSLRSHFWNTYQTSIYYPLGKVKSYMFPDLQVATACDL